MPEMRSLSVLLFSVFLIGGCLAAGVGYSALQVSKGLRPCPNTGANGGRQRAF